MREFFIVLLILASIPYKLCFAEPTSNFETLMGRSTPAWKWMETGEDRENLDFFKSIYENQLSYLQETRAKEGIPKHFYIVWLGYEPFPQSSSRNLHHWTQLHPDWKITLWTDKKRDLPFADIEQKLVEDFNFLFLESPYYETENYGEKSKILRLEILYQEGGVYVDHDTIPMASLDPLNDYLDFYCGLEKLESTILSSSVFPADHIIGAVPEHPILAKMMEHIKNKWSYYDTFYPGSDTPSIVNRVKHRYSEALTYGIKEAKGRRDIIFPSYYFSEKSKDLAKYVVHEKRGRWYRQEQKKQENVKSKLKEIYSKSSHIPFLLGGILVLNLLGMAFLLLYKNSVKIKKI